MMTADIFQFFCAHTRVLTVCLGLKVGFPPHLGLFYFTRGHYPGLNLDLTANLQNQQQLKTNTLCRRLWRYTPRLLRGYTHGPTHSVTTPVFVQLHFPPRGQMDGDKHTLALLYIFVLVHLYLSQSTKEKLHFGDTENVFFFNILGIQTTAPVCYFLSVLKWQRQIRISQFWKKTKLVFETLKTVGVALTLMEKQTFSFSVQHLFLLVRINCVIV